MTKAFNVSRQTAITQNSDIVFFRDFPTLRDVAGIYGTSALVGWLFIQIINISEFCGARGKIADSQAVELSEIIAGSYAFLKLPEFMLFCRRFKMGRYRQFYGSVDPMAILASIKEFLVERNNAHAEHDRTIELRRIEKDKQNPRIMDYEDYIFISQVTAEYSMLTAEQDRLIELKYNKHE